MSYGQLLIILCTLAGAAGSTLAQPAPPLSPVPMAGYEYDAKGNPTRTTVASGVAGFGFATSTTYDSLNRAKDTTDAKLGITRFGYNGREDLTQVTDPRNLVTQYPRNGLGNVTSLLSPDTGTAAMTYDAAGNLKTRIDSRGALATYSYDATNRLTSAVYSQAGQSSQTFSYVYDQTGVGFANGVGRLTSTAHPLGSTQYTYDAQGRLLTEIQRINATTGANGAQRVSTVTYTYDAAGNVNSITYPSGRKLTIGYLDGKPTSMALGKDAVTAPTTLLSQIQWEPFGAPRSWLWQNGAVTMAHNFAYDISGRQVRSRLGNLLRDIAYDAGDRISAYTHYDASTGAAAAANNQSFGYDELGRLTSITGFASTWSIGYDANGNRTNVTLNGTARSHTTAANSNRLSAIANPARVFGYDNAGNTTSDTGSAYTATYDVTGRVSQLTKGNVNWKYAYDGLGRRVRKFASNSSSTTVIFSYDQAGRLMGEYNSAGAALREYIWLGDIPVAVFTPGSTSAAPPLAYYIHADHLNTPRAVLDTTGALRWTWYAEPFGVAAANTNPANKGAFTLSLRFPGQVFDPESGLHYNYFRDYDASVGRYTQSDPIGLAGGINTYAYVGGNPLSYTDPLGLAPWDWDGQGDTGVCRYYDDLARKYPSCGYYKEAADICRGTNRSVNLLTNTALTSAWARGLQDSQSVVLTNVRNVLIMEDRAARSQGLTNADQCTCGNEIDRYHRFAFDFSGLPPVLYGGDLWPQGVPPNPVPRDPRPWVPPWRR